MQIGGESPRFDPVPVVPEVAAPAGGAERPASSGPSFAQILQGVGGVIDRGEGLVAHAGRGGLGSLDSGQLIALQVGIYRYSEAVDLVAKLVDRASNAVRTVVSAQH